MKVKIDTSDIKKLEKELLILSEKGVRWAQIHAVNNLAFKVMRKSRKGLEDKMILRNRWTKRSISTDKALFTQVKPFSEVGSTADYMERQELGATEYAGEYDGSAKGVAIPTSVASGEGQGIVPRRRVARRPNQIANIVLNKSPIRVKAKKQELVVKAKEAIRTGNRFVYHDFGDGRRGILRVTGGRKGVSYRKLPKDVRMSLVQDLSRKSVEIPKNPWLVPVAEDLVKTLPYIYHNELVKQIRLQNGFIR